MYVDVLCCICVVFRVQNAQTSKFVVVVVAQCMLLVRFVGFPLRFGVRLYTMSRRTYFERVRSVFPVFQAISFVSYLIASGSSCGPQDT